MHWACNLGDEEWAEALAGGDMRAPKPPAVDVQAMYVGASGVQAYEEFESFLEAD